MKWIQVDGILASTEIESGHVPDGITIDDTSIEEVIAKLYGRPLNKMGGLGDCVFGRVRLTLQRLDDAD